MIKPFRSTEPKAEIDIHEAEGLYREIQIDKAVTDDQGGKHSLLKRVKASTLLSRLSLGSKKQSPRDVLPDEIGWPNIENFRQHVQRHA